MWWSSFRRRLGAVLRTIRLFDSALRARSALLGVRSRVALGLTSLAGGRPVAAEGSGLHVVAVGTRFVLARRLSGVTADDIRQRNVDLVVAALAKHGVPHWEVDVAPKFPRRIGAPASRRRDVADALLSSAPPSLQVAIDRSGRNERRLQADPLLGRSRRRLERFTRRGSRVSSRRRTRRRLMRRRADQWVVYEVYAERSGARSCGLELGCEVELWPADPAVPDRLVEPRWNRLIESVPSAGRDADALRPDPERPSVYFGDATFPVDIVYTWVDGQDPAWLQAREETLAQLDLASESEEAANRSRFESRDELRYSLRSVELFAGFVNHVWLVTAGQTPFWLVPSHPRLTVVDHRDIFQNPDHLPTFNSHAIEANLHRIEGLAEHYIYMNDDFFFARRVVADDFFLANGMARFFLSRARMPLGAPSAMTKPVDAAAMNGRALIEARFGVSVSRKFKHAPYPQRRSVHEDICRWFPEQVMRTSASKVRSRSDLALASSLHHYAAYLTSRAAPGNISSQYVDVAWPDMERRLHRLLGLLSVDAICVNDSASADWQFETQHRIVREFFEDYFPAKSSFEV